MKNTFKDYFINHRYNIKNYVDLRIILWTQLEIIIG